MNFYAESLVSLWMTAMGVITAPKVWYPEPAKHPVETSNLAVNGGSPPRVVSRASDSQVEWETHGS